MISMHKDLITLCVPLTNSIQPAIDKIRLSGLNARIVMDRVVCEATPKSLFTTITVATDSFIDSRRHETIQKIY
jgi:hypothetical protein